MDLNIQNNVSTYDNNIPSSEILISQNKNNIFGNLTNDLISDFELTVIDSLELNNQVFNDVVSLNLKDELGSIWVLQNVGLVAILIQGDTLVRN